MTAIDIGAVLVAVIAAIGAWAAQHSAAKASKVNATVSGRLEAERGAYERARAFDIQTIAHQQQEIDNLREANLRLTKELRSVKLRLARIENLYPEWDPEWERRLNEERDSEPPDFQ